MKNLSLVLNIVLLAAVIFLYYKVYSSKPVETVVVPDKSNEASIVFVDSDSLLDNYNFYLDMKKVFERKRDSIDNILLYRDKSLKTEAMQYQEKAQNMTNEERMRTEEGLMQKQQTLVELRDNLLDYLAGEEEEMNDTIHTHLTGFLKAYNKAKGYHFILGKQKGSGILLAHDSLNITKQVIEGINRK